MIFIELMITIFISINNKVITLIKIKYNFTFQTWHPLNAEQGSRTKSPFGVSIFPNTFPPLINHFKKNVSFWSSGKIIYVIRDIVEISHVTYKKLDKLKCSHATCQNNM